MSLSSHPHVHVQVSVSPRLALTFYFTHFLTHSFPFLLHLKFVDNLRTPPKESMDLSDEFLLSTRINLPGAPMSPALLYARGARQGSLEGPDMWNQVLDNALREPAGRWESEGTGFMLAKDCRKAQKRRRGSSGDAVKDDGRVLHHLCWADDLYAMSGTMNHLT